jgi:hypothetical protein
VQAGDAVSLKNHAGKALLALELFREFYDPDLSEANLRRHLAAPIVIRDRIEKEKLLSKVLAKHTGEF